MKLIYPGPFDAVHTEQGITAKRGEPVEIPKELAERLLQQGWEKVPAPKPIKQTTPEEETP